MGVSDAEMDEWGYVFATITSNSTKENTPTVCFCSHVDTAPDCSGTHVKPILHKNYQGQDIILPDDPSQVITTKEHPYLKQRIGDDIITASGQTLLGADDKAGVAIIMQLAQELINDPSQIHGDVRILFTPDEEVGSIASYKYIEQSAKFNDVGLLYEPAFPDGSIVKSRKGVGSYTMVIRGKSAHAGRCFHDGLNAFYGVADFINWSKNMMEINEGMTINLGKVEGGGPSNVVPDLAICRFNCRVVTKKQRTEFEHRLQNFYRDMRKKYPGTELHGKFTSPPKPYTKEAKKITEGLQKCAKQLGMNKLKLIMSGGASDGNKLNGYGLPNMDSLGPVGNGMHSRDEMIFIDSLKERTKLSALYLYNITKE